MFDVLTYLFEQFQDPEACGDRGVLMRQLEAAGFEDEEINDALDWLDHIGNLSEGIYAAADDAQGMRIYSDPELKRLPTEVRGFIQFLEDHGAISPSQREMLIDRLLDLADDEINVSAAKLVTLMILWAQKAELPILLGEELLDAVHGEPTMQ